MVARIFVALLCGFIISTAQSEVQETLLLDNSYGDHGDWGIIEICPDNSYAYAIEVQYLEPDLLHLDETAINSVRLYCQSSDGQGTGYVTSTQGDSGDWYGMQICTDSFVTGVRASVQPHNGIFTDNIAIQDIEVECNYGVEIIDGLPDLPESYSDDSTWSTWQTCSEGYTVCGLQVRFDNAVIGDATAVADLAVFCCD